MKETPFEIYEVIAPWPNSKVKPRHLIYREASNPIAHGYYLGEKFEIEDPRLYPHLLKLHWDLTVFSMKPESAPLEKVYCVPQTMEEMKLVHELFLANGWNTEGRYEGQLNTPEEMITTFYQRWDEDEPFGVFVKKDEDEWFLQYHHIRNLRDYGFAGPRVKIPVDVFCDKVKNMK